MRLIAAILNTCFHPPTGGVPANLEEAINWESFIVSARDHGLEGLIYQQLKTAGMLPSCPQTICKQLEQQYHRNLAHNMVLLYETESICRELLTKGISLIIMQGMSFLEEIYPSLGARPLNDIDILIKEEEGPAARRVFSDLGYRPLQYYPWIYVKGQSVLDVHHDPVNISRNRARGQAVSIPIQELWGDSAPINGMSGGRSFCIEDNLLTLCAHLQKHSFSRLIWFVDLGLIIQRHGNRIDWDRLLAKAERYNLTVPLLLVLSRLKCAFGVEAPEEVHRQLSRVKLNLLEKAVLRRLKEGREVGQVGEFLFAFSLESPRRIAAYLLRAAFPHREIMGQIYGISSPQLIWLAYPLRFFQLACRGVKEAMRILRL
jgi:hypothetical protein